MAFARGRQDAFESRLADLSLESLELHRREADQHLRYTRLYVERVRHAFGAERERAGLQRQLRVRDPDGHLAIEDVEPLLLLGMDVPRRADTRRNEDLEQTVPPARVLPANLDRLKHPEQPERLALVLVQQVPGVRALWRDGGHRLLLPLQLVL